MIREKLIYILERKFGRDMFLVGDNPAAIFPAAHSSLGEMKLFDVGSEGRIEIEHIAHGHFYSFLQNATQDENEQEVAEAMAEFVEDVFSGNYVFWRSKDGQFGGWEYRNSTSSFDEISIFAQMEAFFLWSGPVDVNEQDGKET